MHLLQQFSREDRLLLGLEELDTHVDDLNFGQGPSRNALRQTQQTVLPTLGVIAAFYARCCRTKNGNCSGFFRSHERDITRVIARRLLLFVAAVVLFVNDDQAQILNRRKNARARSDNDTSLPVADPPPLFCAFCVAKSRM